MKLLLALALLAAGAALAEPTEALRYRATLIKNARAVWGMDAPIAAFAGQVHQESGWKTDARSKFASGLAQFTPSTAEWIAHAYAGELGENQPLNPSWALRALVRYDKVLFDAQKHGATRCDRYAFALSDYNGGAGWRQKRQRASTNPASYTVTSIINPGVRPEFQAENERYPRVILARHQALYSRWGPMIDCAGVIA